MIFFLPFRIVAKFLSMDALSERDWAVARRFAALYALALLIAVLVLGSTPAWLGSAPSWLLP